MRTYIDFLERFKYQIIILTTLAIALLSISIKDIAYEGSYRIWFDKDSKIMQEYDNFRSTFSGDDTFIVAFKDEKGIFTPKAINTILKLTDEFSLVKGIRKVDSLSNYQYIYSDEDDIIVEDFFYDASDLVRKKELAINDKLILNQLISKDAKSTMFAVHLTDSIGADEEVNLYVMQKLTEITQRVEQESSYKFYITGAPAITASLVSVSQHDAMILMPLAVVIVVVLLFFIFRSFIGILVPSIVIVFTFLTVLSIQMLLGFKLNTFTVNIPAFVTAIAIADAMHLYLAWLYYKSKNNDTKESVFLALQSNIVPIALTSFTTAIGFASLGLSSIEPISTLGVAITSAALIAFIFSITIAPVILLTLKSNYPVKATKIFNLIHIKGYGSFIVKNDKRIVFLFSTLFIVMSFGLLNLKVDSNSIKYFSENTMVRTGSTFIEKELTGSMIYEIIVDSKVDDGVKNPLFLHTVATFETEFREKFKGVRFTTSLKDIIERMQKVVNPGAEETIPNNQNLVAQYLLLYSMSLAQGMEINDKLDTKERYLRLTINTNIVKTSKDLEMIDWVKEWWVINTPYSADVQGQTAIFAYMQSSITDTLINSISVTLLIVLITMLFIFKNIKMLWLFILPNVAPLVFVAGMMGYLNISVDLGVAISAAVILGIAVDDSIHFFSKYFDAIKTKSFEESIDYVISHSGNAMILTTVVLSFTFAIFAVSSFMPNVNFSIVTVIALNIALLLDLVLLPALLSLFYKSSAKLVHT